MTNETKECLSDQRILSFVLRELNGKEVIEFLSHSTECPRCKARVNAFVFSFRNALTEKAH